MLAAVPIRVLLVEDNVNDAELVIDQLVQDGFDPTWERVDTEQEFRDRLSNAIDVILSDHGLPAFNSKRALQIVKERGLDIPFVIVSGTIGEDAAVAAMKEGASDYVLKDRLIRLGEAVRQALRQKQLRDERWQSEIALRESEERFRALIENGSDIIALSDADGVLRYISPSIEHVLGYIPEELIGRNGLAFIDVDDVETEKTLQALGSDVQGSLRPSEIRVRHKDGTQRVLDLVMSNQLHNPAVRGVVTNARDVTERIHAELELTALHNALSVLFTSENLLGLGQQITQAVVSNFGKIDCGLLLVDKSRNQMIRLARAGEYGIETDTPIMLDGLGLVPHTVRVGESVYVPNVEANPDYVPNDPRTVSELVIPLHTAQGVIGVLDLQSPQEAAFSLRDQRILKAFAERAAGALQIMQLYEEVNRYASELEWRVAERTAELQRTKEDVEAILNNSADVIIVIELDGTVANTNPAIVAMFGYASEHILGKPLQTLFEPHEATRVSDALHAALSEHRSVRLDLAARRADGTVFQSDSLFSPINHVGGGIAGVVCSLRDITVRRNLEVDLRNALAKEKELNELKSRFVSMISHEFRTPLAVILSSAEMLDVYAARMTEERKLERLKNIKSQVQRLTNLLEDVLMLGKAEQIGMQFNPMPLNLVTCCQNFVEDAQIAAGKSHQINATMTQSCMDAVGDVLLLQHIVSNLLSNAVKYSPDGTTVHFELSCHNGQATILVRDEGIGIPEKDQVRLFEAFFRAENVGDVSGTGLGLAIVKRAVDAHRGTISFESKENVGTTFTVVLPVRQ